MINAGAGCPKILIVEDEQVLAMDLERSLQQLGYAVVGVADSGAQAIDMAEHAVPDLVLMDIMLKGPVDGIAAADTIRRRWQIPVVFVTANTNDEVLTRAKAAGPYGYIIKPFRTQELNATILVALNQHGLTRELFTEHAWLRTILASLSDGIIATDAMGRVRYLNPAAEQLTGTALGEAVGKAIEEIYPVTTLQREPVERCQLRKALDAKAPVAKQRFLLRHRHGGNLPIEDAAAPIIEGGRALGAVTIFLDITDRLRREQEQQEEHDRLEEQVQLTSEALGQTRAELRALSGHLMTAQEEERRRVARELHDDLAQRAAVTEYALEGVAAFLPRDRDEGYEVLETARRHVRELSAGLRNVSHRLHPSILVDLGLPTALRSLVEEYQRQGAEISLAMREVPEGLPLDVATGLYRIAQEALRNACKHAAESPVRLVLQAQNDQLQLRVEDAGPGFDVNAVRANGGLGLLSMQERARLIGGSLQLRAQPGEGTLILVRVPLRTGSSID